MKRVGIIAGRGRLPVAFASEAGKRGYDVVAVAITPDTDPELASHVSEMHSVSVGQWQKVLHTLHNLDVTDLYLLGKVSKEFLFSGSKVDARFVRLVSNLVVKNDDALILAFVDELEQEGFCVKAQTHLLPALLPGAEVLSAREPSKAEWQDIAFGFSMAKGIAGLDIGQTCVVKDGAVLAVEAIEGTDACIVRGGALCRNCAVVVKVAKPNQDARFDVPTVGLDTLQAMVEAKATVLAFEADATFVIDREPLLALANENGIAVVGFKPGE